jgi:hypothetical protein
LFSWADRWVLQKLPENYRKGTTGKLPRLLRTYGKYRTSGKELEGTKKGLLSPKPASEALEIVGSGGWI